MINVKLMLWIQDRAGNINSELFFKIGVYDHCHVPKLCFSPSGRILQIKKIACDVSMCVKMGVMC